MHVEYVQLNEVESQKISLINLDLVLENELIPMYWLANRKDTQHVPDIP